MRSFVQLMIALFAATISVTALDHPSIRSRQYSPHRLAPREILARQAYNTLSTLQTLNSNLGSPVTNAQNDLSALNNCKTQAQKTSVVTSLCSHVEQCHQIIKSCGGGGGWGGSNPAKPVPSGSPSQAGGGWGQSGGGRGNGGSGGSACSDVGNEYTRTLQTVGTLCGQIKQVLGTLPAGQQSTLQASLDGIQEELSLISDVAESTVPGTTDVVAQNFQNFAPNVKNGLYAVATFGGSHRGW